MNLFNGRQKDPQGHLNPKYTSNTTLPETNIAHENPYLSW